MCKLSRAERFQEARTTFNKNGPQKMDEVAKVTKISKSMISDLENDDVNRDVKYSYIVTLADYYGVSTDYLFGFTDEPNRKPSAVDDLGFDAKIIKTFRYISDCSTDDRQYLEHLNLVMGSPLFQNFLYSLYIDSQAYAADSIYWKRRSDFSSRDVEGFRNDIQSISTSGRYNSLISAYLQQMIRFDNSQDELLKRDDNFPYDVSFTASTVTQIVSNETLESFRSLLNDVRNSYIRSIADIKKK